MVTQMSDDENKPHAIIGTIVTLSWTVALIRGYPTQAEQFQSIHLSVHSLAVILSRCSIECIEGNKKEEIYFLVFI